MGFAAVAGMREELDLVSGYRYLIILVVFFPGYALFCTHSNYMLSKTSIRWWLTCISIGFGVFTLAMGFIHNWTSLIALRLSLRIFEAGLVSPTFSHLRPCLGRHMSNYEYSVVPGVIVVLSTWCPRYYLQKRISLVICGSGLLASLAGLLAYAFSCINAAGYVGWGWIYILEGAITVVLVIGVFFLIEEYPQRSRFLRGHERDILVDLLSRDRASEEEDKMGSGTLYESFAIGRFESTAFTTCSSP
jgi:MFS family permease